MTITYRPGVYRVEHADAAQVLAEVAGDALISYRTAAAIAAGWQSPSPTNEHFTRLSHNTGPDVAALIGEIDAELRYLNGHPEEEAERELAALRQWAVAMSGPSTREGRQLARSLTRECADDRAHDPWGSALMALAMLADALGHVGAEIPSAGTTSSGVVPPDGDSDTRNVLAELRAGRLTVADVHHACRVVDRYADVVERAGRRY